MTKRRHERMLEPSLACGVPKHAHGDTEDEGSPCVVSAVSRWLQDMVRYYDSQEWTITPSGLVRTGAFPVSAFHGRPLSTSIEEFIRRICTCASLDESVVLVAAVYLSRIVEKAQGGLPISSCTVHRLLLQALTVGAKFTLDHPRSNKSMASFADIPVSKFNQLEVKFLCAIQYDLAVTPADIAIAEGALQMTTAHTRKKVKVDVLQDNSNNQSSSASGFAASNNSTKEGDRNGVPSSVGSNNSKEGERRCVPSTDGTENSQWRKATNNFNVGCCDSSEDAIPTALVGEEMPTPDMHDNNSIAESPGWSEASRCLPAESQSTDWNECVSSSKDTDLLPGMPEPTKMSTPERLGSYTLVATAAE